MNGQIMMTHQEASDCLSDIRRGLVNIRERIYDFYDREGWRALGYSSWLKCAQAEFPNWSQSYIYYQLKAARTERGLLEAGDIEPDFSTIVESLPESHLRELGQLSDPLEQRVALQLSYSAAKKAIPSGKPTAALIQEAVGVVNEMKTTGGKVDLGDGKMSNAEGSLIIRHNERVQGRIEETNRKREQKNSAIVNIIKRAQCRIVAARDKQVVFEFDDGEVAKNLMRLYYEKAGHGLLMDLLKKHE